jgi:hypothetical protein
MPGASRQTAPFQAMDKLQLGDHAMLALALAMNNDSSRECCRGASPSCRAARSMLKR